MPIQNLLGHRHGYLVAQIRPEAIRGFFDRMKARWEADRLPSIGVAMSEGSETDLSRVRFRAEVRPRSLGFDRPLHIDASVQKEDLSKMSRQIVIYLVALALVVAGLT